MSPGWAAFAAVLGALVGAGGILAWIKFFRSEVRTADAGVIDTLASAKLKDAQASEVIAEAFTNTLSAVRGLAEDRAKENVELRTDLSRAEKKIEGLEADVSILKGALADLRHFLSPRGDHGEWDQQAHAAAIRSDPSFPLWPPPPSP